MTVVAAILATLGCLAAAAGILLYCFRETRYRNVIVAAVLLVIGSACCYMLAPTRSVSLVLLSVKRCQRDNWERAVALLSNDDVLLECAFDETLSIQELRSSLFVSSGEVAGSSGEFVNAFVEISAYNLDARRSRAFREFGRCLALRLVAATENGGLRSSDGLSPGGMPAQENGGSG